MWQPELERRNMSKALTPSRSKFLPSPETPERRDCRTRHAAARGFEFEL